MELFSVTSAALLLLQSALKSSADDAVVYLLVASPLERISVQEAEALRANSSDNVLRAALLADMAGKAQRRRLEPVVYPRSAFPPETLCTVSGITFFVPNDLRQRLEGGQLSVDAEGLVLTDSNGQKILPVTAK